MKIIKNIFLSVIIALTFAFCSDYQNDSQEEIGYDNYIESDENSAEVVYDLDTDIMISPRTQLASVTTKGYGADTNYSQSNQIQQKIIKNGNLSFETTDLEKTTAQIYELVKKYKAQIQSDTEGKNYKTSYYKNILIRIDSDKFESLLEDISKDVSYFDNKEISSQDVTEQYIDIQSRIKTKKELENRYLELLKKATKVSEMIDIEKNLSKIREEIEAQQGRLNYLQNQISQSTLRIYFYKKTSDTGVTNSYGSKIINAFSSGFNSLSSLFLAFLKSWHVILILVICYWLYKKRKKNKQNKKNEISS